MIIPDGRGTPEGFQDFADCSERCCWVDADGKRCEAFPVAAIKTRWSSVAEFLQSSQEFWALQTTCYEHSWKLSR